MNTSYNSIVEPTAGTLDYATKRNPEPAAEPAMQNALVLSIAFALIPIIAAIVGSIEAFGMGVILSFYGGLIALTAVFSGPTKLRVWGAVALALNGIWLGLAVWSIFISRLC